MEKIRIINFLVKDIFGLDFNQQFESNLIVIFGYNTTGKTNLIKALKHALFGFRNEDTYNHKDYSKVLADHDTGYLEIIFSLNNSIFKISRQIFKGKEGCEVFKLENMSYEEYIALEDLEKEAEWSEAEKNPLFSEPNQIVKSSYIKFKEIFISNGIYPDVFERLIATENNAEFKRAIHDIGGSDGDSGYEAIKDILHKELSEKNEDLKYITDSLDTMMKRLDSHKSKLSKKSQMKINNQLKEIRELSIEDDLRKDIIENIEDISIDNEFSEQINQKTYYIGNLSKKVKDKINNLHQNKDALEKLIPEIEKLSNFMEKIEYKKIFNAYVEAKEYYKKVQYVQSIINSFHTESLEEIPELNKELPLISQLTSIELDNLLEKFSFPKFSKQNKLKELIKDIPSAISELKIYYEEENSLRSLLQKYNVSRSNIWSKRSSYEQLKKILGDSNAIEIKNLDLIPLKGH
ncbi:MAG: AAA family ATPase, partial [Candidatus Thorarchaeota archaeon]